MKNKRIHTDVFGTIEVLRKDGTPEVLDNVQNLQLTICESKYGLRMYTPVILSVAGNVIRYQLPAAQNAKIDLFTIVVMYDKVDSTSATGFLRFALDFPKALNIVGTSGEEDSGDYSLSGDVYYRRDGIDTLDHFREYTNNPSATLDDMFAWLRSPDSVSSVANIDCGTA